MSKHELTPDQELDRYLAGESELTQIYAESEKLTTPAHLESDIRQLAHEQVRGHKPARLTADWVFPVSMAASVLLAVTVVIIMHFSANVSQETQLASDTMPARDAMLPPTELAQVQTDAPQAQTEPAHATAPKTAQNNLPTAADTKTPQRQTDSEPEAFELPAHLRDVVQTTRAVGVDALLPDEVLKQWPPEQWSQHIAELIAQGRQSLADKYRARFKALFPNESLPDPK